MISIKNVQPSEFSYWDEYVRHHSKASVFHLSKWWTVIKHSYGYPTYFLAAVTSKNQRGSHETVQGILPLVHMRSMAFGNELVSMPFFDGGGILCTGTEAGAALIAESLRIGRKLGARHVELRQTAPMDEAVVSQGDIHLQTNREKVRMLLELPSSSEELMHSFKSKLRSQIKNPMKKGLETKVGGIELLKDFYRVFAENMRDLGSPVHSIKLMTATLETFKEKARIFLVHRQGQPLAASIVIDFNNIMVNPWASSLRRFRSFNPNMLLYWRMLEYACDNGFKFFDFGRSSPDEGTYRFKRQWGCTAEPMAWHTIRLQSGVSESASPQKNDFLPLIKIWQRLPVTLTKIIGPPIRKRINL